MFPALHTPLVHASLPPPRCAGILSNLAALFFPGAEFISNTAVGGNPLCCKFLPALLNGYLPLGGTANARGILSGGSDLVLVNGGLMPSIPVTPGQWQRWRMAFTAMYKHLVLQVGAGAGQAGQVAAAAGPGVQAAMHGPHLGWLLVMDKSG